MDVNQVNLFSPDVIADPFPVYRQMHEHGPIVRNDLLAMWMVCGHEPALRVLRDPAGFSSTVLAATSDRSGVFGGAATMLTSDPPEHERLRGVVQRAFSPRAISKLTAHVEAIVDRILDGIVPGEPFDIVGRLAFPLPVTVIAELLGVPSEDRETFRRWSDDVVGGQNETSTQGQLDAATVAASELRSYFRDAIARRRAEPGDDLMSLLIAANEDSAVTEDELLASCIILLIAGNETTTKLIGNALMVLASEAGARDRLVREQDLIAPAVEELIRLVGTAQATMRQATADVELAGTSLAAGELVFVMLAAANRDPSVFAEPDEFRPERSPNPHVGFGHGTHFCVGATLARLEARTALGRFISRFPYFDVAAHRWAPSFFLRGLESLNIVVSSVAPAMQGIGGRL